MAVKVEGFQVLVKRIITLVILVALGIGGYWAWVNRDYLLHRAQNQYDWTAYGLNWKVQQKVAEEKAKRENKEILLVYLGDKDPVSDRLRKTVFPNQAFKLAENNYVLILVETPADASKITARHKAFNEEMMKRYNLDRYGTFLVATPGARDDMNEVRRFTCGSEGVAQLLDKIAGGRFVARKAVDSTPQLKTIEVPKVEGIEKVLPKKEGKLEAGEEPAPVKPEDKK